jgi:hypothetical protein
VRWCSPLTKTSRGSAKVQIQDVRDMINLHDILFQLQEFHQGHSALFDAAAAQLLAKHIERIDRTLKEPCTAICDPLGTIARQGPQKLKALLRSTASTGSPKAPRGLIATGGIGFRFRLHLWICSNRLLLAGIINPAPGAILAA